MPQILRSIILAGITFLNAFQLAEGAVRCNWTAGSRCILTTHRLILRSIEQNDPELTEEDSNTFIQAYSNASSTRHYGLERPLGPEEARKVAESYRMEWEESPYWVTFLIYEQGETDLPKVFSNLNQDAKIGQFIGFIRLGTGWKDHSSEIGYFLLPEFWNKKYASESIEAVLGSVVSCN